MLNRTAIGVDARRRRKTDLPPGVFIVELQYRIGNSNAYKVDIYVINVRVFQLNVKLT